MIVPDASEQLHGAAGRRYSASSCLPSARTELIMTTGDQVDSEPSCDEDTTVAPSPIKNAKSNVADVEPSPKPVSTKGEQARLRLELQSARASDKCLRTRSYNPSGGKWKASRPRVRLLYQDEGLRTRFCTNAQGLLDAVLKDSQASTSARIARKALRYRNVLHRLGDVDPQDPAFDISSFFGVEWCKRTAISAE